VICGACPRCGGPTYRDADKFSEYTTCLICGWVREDHAGTPVLPEMNADGRVQRRTREPRRHTSRL